MSALHKILRKEVVKIGFVFVVTSDANVLYQLRSKLLPLQRDFDLKYTQDISLLHIHLSRIYLPSPHVT